MDGPALLASEGVARLSRSARDLGRPRKGNGARHREPGTAGPTEHGCPVPGRSIAERAAIGVDDPLADGKDRAAPSGEEAALQTLCSHAQTIVADRIPQTTIAIGSRVEHARRLLDHTQYPPRIAGGKPGDGTRKLRGKAPLDVAQRERTQVLTVDNLRPLGHPPTGVLVRAVAGLPGRKGQISASKSIADAIMRPGSRGVIARRP